MIADERAIQKPSKPADFGIAHHLSLFFSLAIVAKRRIISLPPGLLCPAALHFRHTRTGR
jgi:hypothetical protein